VKEIFGLLDREDKILTILFLVAFCSLFLFWVSRDWAEIFDGGKEIYGYGLNIVLGYLLSYLFYLINILLPKLRSRKDVYNCIGDYIAYLCFNSLMISDCLNKNHKDIQLLILHHHGISRSYQRGMAVNPNMFQEEVKKSDLILVEHMYEKIRSNAQSIEPSVTEFINSALYAYLPLRGIFSDLTSRDKILQSQIIFAESKKYSQIDPIGLIVKRYIRKINLLIEKEPMLFEYDLAIYLGDSTDKLKAYNPL
jgi:hypothetical protein